MGWERLVELITEPALLMRRNGVLANAAWTALIGAKPQSAVALGLLLKNAALATLVEQSLETGKELTASVSLPAKLLSSHTCDLKIVPLDRESYCCVLPGGWKDSYEQVLASHGTTMGCVFELDGGNAASQVWTSNVHLPPHLASHLLAEAPAGLRFAQGELSAAMDSELKTPDGSALYSTRSIRIGPTNVMVMADDVTDKGKLRAAIEEQQRSAKALVEEASIWHRFFLNSPVMMAIVELTESDFTFIATNTAMQTVLRNVGSEITAPVCASAIHFSTEDLRLFVAHLTQSRETSAPVQFDYAWPIEFAPNRQRLHTSCWVNPVRSSAFYYLLFSSRFALVCKDITDRIVADQRLRVHERELETLVVARTQQLEAALTVKSRFLATMSHEIRTPLSGIIGSLTLLGETQLGLDQKDLVSLAQLCGEQLLLLINDILDHTRLAEAKVKLEIAPFYIDLIMEEVLGMMAYPAEQKAIELISVIEPGTAMSVLGDVHRVRQVLVNLMSNAVKFTSVGHVMLRVGSRALSDDRVELLFTVIDTGTGIEPEIAKNLFQPFTQGDSSMSRRYGGSGLGLYISRSIANLMEGSVWFESTPGKGSTFFFSMVAKKSPTTGPERPPMPEKGRNVWVCVPNEVARYGLHAMLTTWGFRVSLFGTIEAAFASLHGMDPRSSLALIDTSYSLEQIQTLSCRMQTVLIGWSRRSVPPELQQLPFAKKPVFNQALRRQLLSLLSPGACSESVPSPKVVSCQDPNLNILIADDQPTNQMIIRKLLSTLGYQQLRFVDNGRQAVEAVTEGSFDVVLMDVMMPEMNGVDATIAIRLKKPCLPVIIAVTANAFTEEQEKYISAGMDGVLTKPIRLGELKTALDKCIQELPGRREIAQYSPTRIPLIDNSGVPTEASFTIPSAAAIPAVDARPLPTEKRRRVDLPPRD